jgi:hypothetical protein
MIAMESWACQSGQALCRELHHAKNKMLRIKGEQHEII